MVSAHLQFRAQASESGMQTQSSTTQQDATWVVASVVAFVVMVAMNALANTLPLFGRATGEVSDGYPSLFTPAPYTFSVWGLIYLLLAGFVIYQALPAVRHDPRLRRARPLFVLSSLLNVLWLVSWHALAIPVSELIMLALLGTLIALYVGIGAWRAAAPPAQRWLLDLPVSVYLGWISVATIANTAIFLLHVGFDAGTAESALTIVMVAAAALLGVLAVIVRRDWAYTLVIAWGLGGIAAARAGDVGVISTAALAGAAAALLAAVVALLGRMRARANIEARTP